MLNMLFAVCGIIGSLYGFGEKSVPLFARGTAETALFVRAPRFDPYRCI
jgi:hypothetical protein